MKWLTTTLALRSPVPSKAMLVKILQVWIRRTVLALATYYYQLFFPLIVSKELR